MYGHSLESLVSLHDENVIDRDTLRTKESVLDSSYISALIGMKTFSFDATDY